MSTQASFRQSSEEWFLAEVFSSLVLSMSSVSPTLKRLSRRDELSSNDKDSVIPNSLSSFQRNSSGTSPGPPRPGKFPPSSSGPEQQKQSLCDPTSNKAQYFHDQLSPLPMYEDLLAIARSRELSNSSSNKPPSPRPYRGGGVVLPSSKPSESPSPSKLSTSGVTTSLSTSSFPRKRSRPPSFTGTLPPLPPFTVPLAPPHGDRSAAGAGHAVRKPPLSPGKEAAVAVSLPRRHSVSPPLPSTPTSTLSYPSSSAGSPSHSHNSSPSSSRNGRSMCPPPPKPTKQLPLSRPRSPMSPQSPATSLLGLMRSMGSQCAAYRTGSTECKSTLHDEAARMWDMMFIEGWRADVHICCDGGRIIPAHSAVIGMSSPILKRKLEELSCNGRIFIRDMPFPAVRAFVRFLYSARYEEEDMQAYALHLIVLAHAFNVPALKRACTEEIAGSDGKLSVDTAIDMLQLACRCDAPRLRLLVERFVVSHFKEIVQTDGWKVMMDTDPDMERHILEAVVEAEGKQEERRRKLEEDAMFQNLYDAMQALVHICRDGCRSIRPHDCTRSLGQAPSCRYEACQGVENLLRHFAACQSQVSGGCTHCKRMWQLLELHSRMCQEDGTCRVILCRHFKEKRGSSGSIEETKWQMLAKRVACCRHSSGSNIGTSRSQRQSSSAVTMGGRRAPQPFAPVAQSRDCPCRH